MKSVKQEHSLIQREVNPVCVGGACGAVCFRGSSESYPDLWMDDNKMQGLPAGGGGSWYNSVSLTSSGLPLYLQDCWCMFLWLLSPVIGKDHMKSHIYVHPVQTEFSVIQALGILEESLCGAMWELIHFMANRRGKVEAVTSFIFLGSKISMDGDCSHEIKRHSLLGRKVMTNLESILKSRDITLTAKVCVVKGMVFLVVMHGCESRTMKKAEHQRIGAFKLWCWRRLLRVPWTARRSN